VFADLSRRSTNAVRRIALLSATATVAIALGTLRPAVAAPITYDLVGMTATIGPGTFITGGTDTLTGSFTFDPDTDALSAVSITVAGINPPPDGIYNIPDSGQEGPPVTFIEAEQPGDNILELIFTNPLGTTADPLDHITIVASNPDFSATSESATGSAVPATPVRTPEPDSLALAATALGLLLLLRSAARRA
jgi:hypothetical protein